jgi:hypothetical protein
VAREVNRLLREARETQRRARPFIRGRSVPAFDGREVWREGVASVLRAARAVSTEAGQDVPRVERDPEDAP